MMTITVIITMTIKDEEDMDDDHKVDNDDTRLR